MHASDLLGPNPSLIISYYHKPPHSLVRHELSQAELHEININVPDISFVRATRMLNGSLLVYLKPTEVYSKKELLSIALKLKKIPEVEAVTPNFLSSIMEIDTDTQWNLDGPPGGIEIENTWLEFTTGASDITIVVLDTGTMNHGALNSNLLKGVHFTEANHYGTGAEPSCKECSGYNHGTLVASIIAATGESVYGRILFGVAPRSTVLPINVFTQFTDVKTCGFPPCLYSYLSDQLNALYWLSGENFPGLPEAPKHIVGINMSFGSTQSCPKIAQKIIDKLHQKNSSFIAAAGNQNKEVTQNYPANCKHMIAVAATGRYGERADYSNWGEGITLAAPGGNRKNSIFFTTEQALLYKQGTSFAAPHVSGVIALLYSIDKTLTTEQVKTMITSPETISPFPTLDEIPAGSQSCLDITVPKKSCGAGILNAYKAVKKTIQLRVC